MQTNDNFLLAPPPADTTTASTGAEADSRDQVRTATAAVPPVAHHIASHAREHARIPNGEASHNSILWASASYPTSGPQGRSQSNCACHALRAHDACETTAKEREQDVQETKNEKTTAFRPRLGSSLEHEAGSLDGHELPSCVRAQFLNGHLEVPIDFPPPWKPWGGGGGEKTTSIGPLWPMGPAYHEAMSYFAAVVRAMGGRSAGKMSLKEGERVAPRYVMLATIRILKDFHAITLLADPMDCSTDSIEVSKALQDTTMDRFWVGVQ